MSNLPNEQKVTRFLKTQFKEAVKQYLVYDGFFRMTDVYAAPVDAVHGDECLRTQYAYDGGSVRIQKTKESIATWDSAWEI
jgi:hypothetical protein